MLLLSTPKISLQETLKNAGYCKENHAFYAELITHLTMQSRSAPEGTFDGTPKNTLSDLHNDVQEGVCEVALKGALEAALELHLWLHFLMQRLMRECVQNVSSNAGPVAAIESAIDGELNVGFKWVFSQKEFSFKAIVDAQ